MSVQILHSEWFPDLVAAVKATGMQVVVAEGTTGTIDRFEITSVYVDECPQLSAAHIRPTHKGKVMAQWKNERRGRRP